MSALLGTVSILAFLVLLVLLIYYAVKKNPVWKKCLIGVIASFALLCYAISLPTPPPSAETTAPKVEHDPLSAFVMSQTFVEKQLKAPATAKFPLYSESKVTDLGDGKYKVDSYVDAQNSFGAMIRTNYTCTLKYVGDDKWQAEEVQLLE